MFWIRRTLHLPPFAGGVRLITREILDAVPEIREIEIGMFNIFMQHTSASITINENAAPDVQSDLDMSLRKIVPESFPYEHTIEGRDDMPGHVKSSLVGVSLNIPIGNGRLLLGTWQGIYLCEHRYSRHSRTVILSAFGEKNVRERT